MDTPKPTDSNDDKKVETPYVTLADKKPSLMSLSVTSLHRSISTRELSNNLQTTRDGLMMMNLMRNNDDREGRTHGSKNNYENDDHPSFTKGLGGYRKTRKSGDNRSSLVQISNEYRKHGESEAITSNEFFNPYVDQFSTQHFKNGGSKSRLCDGKKSEFENDGIDDSEEAELGKLLSSQNPKKDGSLHSRIFIDAFLPSLEGNRIFPLFNYRCAESIERTSKDFYARNEKSKQLLAVSSAEKSGNVERYFAQTRAETIAQQIRRTEIENQQREEEVENLDDFLKEEASQKMEQVLEQNEKLQHVQCLDVAVEIEELHIVKEKEEVLVLQSVEEEVEGKEEALPTSIETNSEHPASGVDPTNDKEKQPELNEQKAETTENTIGNIDGSSAQVEYASPEEKELFQKALRTLVENEELVDFFCEKVISKIEERNDFCRLYCKSTCGGLNKPSEQCKG